MNWFLKWVSFSMLAVVVAVGLLFAVSQILFDDMSSCDEDSGAVTYARSLPQERLARLYQDVKSFAKEGRTLYRIESTSDLAPFELADLRYHDILMDGSYRSRIMLEGCFDHYVILDFEGIYDGKAGAIMLSWGEGPGYGKQQLWPAR